MAAEACGASFGQNFYYKQLFTPASVEDADWSYNGEKAQYFTFYHDVTLPATRTDGSAWAAGGTDIVVRFYQKNAIDTEAGKQSISLLIPGNVTANYYDATGRRILKRVCPSRIDRRILVLILMS